MSLEVPPPDVIHKWGPFIIAFLGQVIPIAGDIQTITSFWRSPAHNAQVGGLPNSQHTIGTALDVIPRGPYNAFADRARNEAGLVAVVEGDHVHLQLFDAGYRPGEEGVSV